MMNEEEQTFCEYTAGHPDLATVHAILIYDPTLNSATVHKRKSMGEYCHELLCGQRPKVIAMLAGFKAGTC